MPRRRHVRVALQIAIVTVTFVFVLSFFPGTPSSVYNSNDVDLSAFKPYNTPIALQSSNPVVGAEPTTTSPAHSGTYGKAKSSQENSSNGNTGAEKADTGKSDAGISDSEKTNKGKAGVGNPISGKGDTGKTGSGKSDIKDTDSGKKGSGKTSPGHSGSEKTDSDDKNSGTKGSEKGGTGHANSLKGGSGLVDSEKASSGKTGTANSESDSGKNEQDESEKTTEHPPHDSNEADTDTESEESKLGFAAKYQNAGVDKPETFKRPNRYGHKTSQPLTSHSFTKVALNKEASGPSRLGCPEVSSARYRHLLAKKSKAKNPDGKPRRKFYFALDLFDCQAVLPSLLGAIIDTIRFLGPENCALSIVEGRSRDWTYDIIAEVGEAVEKMGVAFNLTTNPVDPLAEGGDRIIALAELRNQALQPLYDHPEDYTDDSMVLFINDINPCVDDILELAHQLDIQKADMTCSMDWQSRGSVFYDFWVSRAINGDSFFEIPQNGAWDFSQNMFWNEPRSKERMDAMQPVQVYACWNGMVVFKTEPLLKDGIRFRAQRENECYMGEPTYLCKDFWAHGHGRIAIVPSVNVAYTLTESVATKKYRGYVDEVVDYAASTEVSELIDWQKEPPAMVKCAKTWDKPSWVPPL